MPKAYIMFNRGDEIVIKVHTDRDGCLAPRDFIKYLRMSPDNVIYILSGGVEFMAYGLKNDDYHLERVSASVSAFGRLPRPS